MSRMWLALVLAIALIAGSVLYAARAQQKTAETNFGEAQIASSMRSMMLQQEWGLDGYLVTGSTEELQPFFDGGRLLTNDLAHARKASADDPFELAAVARQAVLWQRWKSLAGREIARVEAGHVNQASASSSERRDELIDRFISANSTYSARLTVNRHAEENRAALVPVWLIIGLSALFVVAGWLLLRRTRRLRHEIARNEDERRGAELAVTIDQARFAEALQVSEDQSEAQNVLTAHLEARIPDSEVVVLNRNNSANRLEATEPLAAGHPLERPLLDSKPRSCLAVRLSRQYDRQGSATEVLSCKVCGALDRPSTCQPFLVGGEVIGSVLVAHDQPLTLSEQRRLVESVAQAAPVFANLRNLAVAEIKAATDALTGLPNRRAIDDTLKHLFAHATRTSSPFSVALLDLDHFKQINDSFGHDRGDDVLASLGALLQGELRGSDVPGRTGGEEFVILLPDTDRAGAVELAQKVSAAVRRLRIKGVDRPITASVGIASYPEDADTTEQLTRLADRALYAAKRLGRDRVETSGSTTPLLDDESHRLVTA